MERYFGPLRFRDRQARLCNILNSKNEKEIMIIMLRFSFLLSYKLMQNNEYDVSTVFEDVFGKFCRFPILDTGPHNYLLLDFQG
jgi:hypothetical protein